MELKNSKTYHNLAKAYAGECMARTRYEFIAYGARQEGYMYMAQLIEDIAKQEFNHARMYYSFIETASDGTIKNIDISSGYPFKEKWNLIDNLKFAAEDEETEEMRTYPTYAVIAREEGFPDIAGLFDNIAKIEHCHKLTFKQLYTQMKDGSMYKKDKPTKWKCSGCGHEDTLKSAWETCPVCQAKQGCVMIKIEDNA